LLIAAGRLQVNKPVRVINSAISISDNRVASGNARGFDNSVNYLAPENTALFYFRPALFHFAKSVRRLAKPPVGAAAIERDRGAFSLLSHPVNITTGKNNWMK
jgi:hypothetical protein